MEGRPAEVLRSGDTLEERVDRLVALNEASRFREQLLFPTTLAVVVVMGLVCAAAIAVLARRNTPRLQRIVAFAALADMAVLPLSFLARGFPLEDLGAGFYWLFVSLGAVVVVIGMPVFGSDVGGIIAFTPTILVFAALVTGYRVRVRTVVVGLLATVAAVTAFGLLDLARPAGERAHLGRLFERVGDEGLEPLLSIMERKLLANLGVTTSSFWVAAIPIAVAFLVFLSRYPTRPMARLRRRIPTLRAGIVATIVAAVLGSAVNDSGAIVGGVALFVLVASLAWLALDELAAPRTPSDAAPAEGIAGEDTGEPPATGEPAARPDGGAQPGAAPTGPPARAGADPAWPPPDPRDTARTT